MDIGFYSDENGVSYAKRDRLSMYLWTIYPKTIAGIKYCGNCKDGKIKVYTEAELKEAVQAEREACAVVCEKLFIDVDGEWQGDQYAEAIRKRGEK